jgi:hypothetical protein
MLVLVSGFEAKMVREQGWFELRLYRVYSQVGLIILSNIHQKLEKKAYI